MKRWLKLFQNGLNLSKVIQICQNWFKLVKYCQTCPNWFKRVQIGSNMSITDYTWLKWIKHVQIGFNLSKMDEACQNWIKFGSNMFKIDQNLFKLFKIKMSRGLDRKVLFSLFWREKLTSTRGPLTYLVQLSKLCKGYPWWAQPG